MSQPMRLHSKQVRCGGRDWQDVACQPRTCVTASRGDAKTRQQAAATANHAYQLRARSQRGGDEGSRQGQRASPPFRHIVHRKVAALSLFGKELHALVVCGVAFEQPAMQKVS